MPNPTRDTTAGRIYNDLRNLARRTGHPSDLQGGCCSPSSAPVA